jgi:hypothetical protein
MPGWTTAPNPEGRFRPIPALLLLAVLAWTGVGRTTDGTSVTPTSTSPENPSPGSETTGSATDRIPWLEEVRAQRQALEARRQANRAAFAAQREAREDRREALRAHLEQDWAELQALRPPLADPRFPQGSRILPPAVTPPAVAAPTAPPDWNNLWYYRGY